MFVLIWPAVRCVWSPCPRRATMGHVYVGHHWDWVAMDILDIR